MYEMIVGDWGLVHIVTYCIYFALSFCAPLPFLFPSFFPFESSLIIVLGLWHWYYIHMQRKVWNEKSHIHVSSNLFFSSLIIMVATLNNTVQCSTVQYNTIQYSTVHTVHTVQYSTYSTTVYCTFTFIFESNQCRRIGQT